MASDYNTLTPEQVDVFREIGNIGAGNAATALASLLNRPVKMDFPDVKLVPFNDIPYIVGGPETVIVGGIVELSGDLSGYLILVVGLEQAGKMVSILLNSPNENSHSINYDSFSDLDKSALNEIMNILCGSYLSAIGSLTQMKITPSIPYICVDMMGAILSIVAIEFSKFSDNVLFFETKFSDKGKDTLGNFFLAPNQESYERLLTSLGVSP